MKKIEPEKPKMIDDLGNAHSGWIEPKELKQFLVEKIAEFENWIDCELERIKKYNFKFGRKENSRYKTLIELKERVQKFKKELLGEN